MPKPRKKKKRKSKGKVASNTVLWSKKTCIVCKTNERQIGSCPGCSETICVRCFAETAYFCPEYKMVLLSCPACLEEIDAEINIDALFEFNMAGPRSYACAIELLDEVEAETLSIPCDDCCGPYMAGDMRFVISEKRLELTVFSVPIETMNVGVD